MKFKEYLKRYHISPLSYCNGEELEESDYIELLRMLVKYAYCKPVKIDFSIKPEILKKIDFINKNSLIPPTEEDVMDVLMEQEQNIVI